MRILAISDLHSHKSFLLSLSDYLNKEKFDLCLISGDITNRYSDYMTYLISLENIFSKFSLPWYCIHGNNDHENTIEYLKKAHRDLHFSPVKFQNYRLAGIGWGSELPPYELALDQDTIFLTHEPPTIPTSKIQQNLSNFPLLHICGHKHSWARFQDIGNTRVIIIPAAINNRIATIDLPSRQIKFITLPPTTHTI